jgi:site-specific DNA-methyltransferase (adenine-specific)
MANLLCGDMVKTLRTIPDRTFDAVICDPPYELGFMGRGWDSSGVAFNPRTWREARRVAKPGAWMAAFGGSRTWHRIACAIEDGGWEIRDSMIWWYASGFPKSTDVGAQMDASVGAVRTDRVVSEEMDNQIMQPMRTVIFAGTPVTAAAKKWDGWGTALKPAFEPIILARKPIDLTVAANVKKYGTGAINIKASRVGDEEHYNPPAGTSRGASFALFSGKGSKAGFAGTVAKGYWPPNMVFSHAPACTPEGGCAKGCPTLGIDKKHRGIFPAFYAPKASREERERGCEDLPAKRVNDAIPEGASYATNPRAGVQGERHNHHPTVKPVSVMAWISKLLTQPGGHILDPFMGSGTTGIAAAQEGFEFTGIDLDPAHVEIAKARIAAAVRKEE